MTIKPWMYVLVAVLIGAGVYGVWKIGDLHGYAEQADECNTRVGKINEANETAKTTAANDARIAQAALDAEALEKEKQETARLTQAVKEARDAVAVAAAKNAALTQDYARLKAHDANIQKWGASCLPAGILVSLHGQGYSAAGKCTP